MKKISVLIFLIAMIILSPYEAFASDANPMYCIDITWGSFSFVYDKGSWNTDTLQYEKASSSLSPAKGTTDGEAGWYGFNGEANKISVTNSSDSTNQKDVNITLTATSEIKDTSSNVTGDSGYTGISYAIYATNTWDDFDGYSDASSVDAVVKYGETKDFFLSILGTPNEDIPSTSVQIGSLTVTVNK